MPKTEPPSFRTPFTVESYRSYLQCERKRNLLVDKDRGGRKKRERGREGSELIERERERGKRKKDDGAMGPPPKPSLSPTNFSPATSRLDETRSSHVTLNWSIIWQSCPNRRHSQAIRDYPCQTIAKVSSSIGGPFSRNIPSYFRSSRTMIDYIYIDRWKIIEIILNNLI